jgi:hypothetical protein
MIDLTGKVIDIKRDYRTSRPVVSLAVNEDLDSVAELGDSELRIRLSLKKDHRSLDSNAYFHVLCDKLRQKIGISMMRCKNQLIARYGQIEYLSNGEIIGYTTQAPPEYMLEQEIPHVWMIDAREVKGKTWYTYRLYRGSHTYNTAEMSQLIDGTIYECKQVGIETATPEEIARMAILWEKRYEQQSERKTG